MNIDPEKIKELVLVYSKLNEDYQKELMNQAYVLQLKQTQLKQIQEEKLIFKSDMELQSEIDRRASERVNDIVEMADLLDKMNSTDKAALFMLINQLSGKGNSVEESDITITVNQRNISMEEYLEKYLIDADYNKAKEKASKFMSDINNRSK